jgi:hypothetical protein
MSPSEKINIAIPAGPQLIAAKSGLLAMLDADKSNQQVVAQSLERFWKIRALSCAGGVQVGRFESPATTKIKLTDIDCFRRQDEQLVEWIGLQRMALLLRMPALRKFEQLEGKATFATAENPVMMSVAAAANVAAIKSRNGQFSVFDLTGGKVISTFHTPGDSHRVVSISPNGRMLAVPLSNRGLAVFELETGSILWNTEKYIDVLAWLPNLDAIILNETNLSKAGIMDLRTGKVEPYLPAERKLSWGISLLSDLNVVLIGAQNSVSLVAHARNSVGGLLTTSTKSWRVNGNLSSQFAPMLLGNGKILAYSSNRDLGWLNLQNDEQGKWETSFLKAHNFSKFDESTIAFTEPNKHKSGSQQKLLDIETLNVSTVLDAVEGYPLTLAPRSGNARSINNAIVIQTSAKTGNSLPLLKLVSEAQLEEQLLKLIPQPEIQSSAEPTKYEPHEIKAAEANLAAIVREIAIDEAKPRSERGDYIALWSKWVKANNVVMGMRDGLPREVIERKRLGVSQNSPLNNDVTKNAKTSDSTPLPTNIPTNSEVAAIGVYQGSRSTHLEQTQSNSLHSPGEVTISVVNNSKPLVLVLSSYESVQWRIKNPENRKIAAILLSGYYPSKVIGVSSDVKVYTMGRSYAYKQNSSKFEVLSKEVKAFVLSPITSFQGRYEGRDFQIH